MEMMKVLEDALVEIAVNRDETGCTLSGSQCADIAAAALLAAGLGGRLPEFIAARFGDFDDYDALDNPDELPA